MKHKENNIIIVGGGHAGLEAALIARHLGKAVLMVTMDVRAVGRMSCNPAIGGLAKGQMVREIDMLGGKMGVLADFSGIQFKTLNKKKGRAVWSPRAQVDKRVYENHAFRLLETSGCQIVSGEVISLMYEKHKVTGVKLRSGENLKGSAVIITSGTFLSGLIHVGDRKIRAGRMGEDRSEGLAEHLESVGFLTGRLKTGTPPRLDKKSIDWSKTSIVKGDKDPTPFSYLTADFSPPNVPCHTIYTNNETHSIIEQNKDRSPMFTGDINGTGPRYCPSIEDKVHRFIDRESHLLFLEPEWKDSDQIYLNGFSTSLPESVQLEALQQISALRNVRFLRPGYAIEYDFFPPSQLKNTLETKHIEGLFFAGQVNGTSGYEEAAAQGVLAGINASKKVEGQDQLTLTRDSSYIGVMIDDLITKDTLEPYRMFTSRAEHRLILRVSNTCERLLPIAKDFDLHKHRHLKYLNSIVDNKEKTLKSLSSSIKPSELNTVPPLNQPTPASSVLKRVGVSIFDLPRVFKPRNLSSWLVKEVCYDVESEIKYRGYIDRHRAEIKKISGKPEKLLPHNIDYSKISGLSSEAIEKLSFVKPQNVGQAKNISGVTPTDVSVLLIYLKSKGVSRETSSW